MQAVWVVCCSAGIGAVLGLLFQLRHKSYGLKLVLVIVALAIGACTYGLTYARLCPGRPAVEPGVYTTLTGVIESVTQKQRNTELWLEVTSEGELRQPCRFRVLALVPVSTVWQTGQRVRVNGIYVWSVSRKQGVLDALAPFWLFRGNAYPMATGHGWFTDTGTTALAAMQKTVSTNRVASATLAESIVIGKSAPIADTTQSAFLAAGVAHLLAASGANVTFALRLALLPWRFAARAAGRWRKTARCVYALAVIWVFAALCGGTLSIIRAAFAASYRILATSLGRSAGGGVTLTASCLLFAIALPADFTQPSTLLSMFATFAVCEATDLVEVSHVRGQAPNSSPAWYPLPKILNTLWRTMFHSIITSLVVDAYLLPIVWWMFGQWTPYSAIATVLLEPMAAWLLPLTVLWAALSLFASLVAQNTILFDLAHACGILDTNLVSIVMAIVRTIAHWQWSLVQMPPLPLPAALLCVIAMACCRRLHLPYIANRRLRIQSRVNRQTI
ncbi:ComEC/Rec2 family competence protein [Alicyclobacillus hesperidum]|uniref:ComEC/Rec2 family competence protein n=1 Tax=Alicyclobacillus hesperidum TaxID=89784 RepID=UPI0002E2BEEB|nr:ComEC/Rec2 family competence protein [Alicyclobacillus hesperidum]